MVWCRNQKIYNEFAPDCFLSYVVVWCRNQKIYNRNHVTVVSGSVVVWCRNQKIYNKGMNMIITQKLWFGVGIKRYTTKIPSVRWISSCGLV